MAAHVDPLVRAARNVGIGFERAERLHGVHLLHAERLAMADQRRGILPVVHVLGQHRHVARAHGDRLPQNGIPFRRHKPGEAGDALSGVCGIGTEIDILQLCCSSQK